MIGANPDDTEQVRAVMEALANARGGRKGVPVVANAVEMLETMGFSDIIHELRDDARAVLTALRSL